mmetsp:Transcript_92337/g.183350  ORF Transcript_92337/g.183350 Transcript_92337/m.183350 type:complete len:240 (-) Transcript_92337:216-935(-)
MLGNFGGFDSLRDLPSVTCGCHESVECARQSPCPSQGKVEGVELTQNPLHLSDRGRASGVCDPKSLGSDSDRGIAQSNAWNESLLLQVSAPRVAEKDVVHLGVNIAVSPGDRVTVGAMVRNQAEGLPGVCVETEGRGDCTVVLVSVPTSSSSGGRSPAGFACLRIFATSTWFTSCGSEVGVPASNTSLAVGLACGRELASLAYCASGQALICVHVARLESHKRVGSAVDLVNAGPRKPI